MALRIERVLATLIVIATAAPFLGTLAKAQSVAPPSGTVAIAAYDALKKNCARCHQSGELTRAKPAANFANILDLAELAKTSPFVQPGNPDGSRLYTMITKGEMPHDVHQQLGDRRGPTADEIDAIRQWITTLSSRTATPLLKVATGQTRYSFGLELTTNKTTYAKDDHVTISVTASQPCYLTLINVESDGLATVIYPNDFERQNVIAANQRLVVPRPTARYVFPASTIGRETVIAKCSLSDPQPPGISHNFTEQRFTELGNYRAFMRRHYGSDSEWEKKNTAAEDKGAITLPQVSMETAVIFDVTRN